MLGLCSRNRRRPRRERLFDRAEAKRVPLRAILTIDAVILVTIVAVIVVAKLRETILLVVVAAFLALILNPPVVLLQRRARMRRGYAVAIVTVVGVGVFAGIAFLFGVPLVTALTNFISKLPGYVQKAEQGKGWIGHELKRLHLQSWLQKNEPKLTQYAQNLSGPVLRFGKATFTAVLDVVIIFMLVILLMLEAPKIRVGLMAMLPAERALRAQPDLRGGLTFDHGLHARRLHNLGDRRRDRLRRRSRSSAFPTPCCSGSGWRSSTSCR